MANSSQKDVQKDADNNWQRLLPIAVLVLGLVVSGLGARWQGYPCNPTSTIGDLFSRLSPLVFFALLIERTVEVVMSVWRSEDSNRLVAEVRRLKGSDAQGNSEKDAALKAELKTAEEALGRFKAATLLAAIGVRSLSLFIDAGLR